MFSYGPPHMAKQKQGNQLKPTYSSSVLIRDVALGTYQKRWTIRGSGKRGSGISVLVARQDDEMMMYLHIHYLVQEKLTKNKHPLHPHMTWKAKENWQEIKLIHSMLDLIKWIRFIDMKWPILTFLPFNLPCWQDIEYADCILCKRSKTSPTQKRLEGVLDMTLNCIWWWGTCSEYLESEDYLFS